MEEEDDLGSSPAGCRATRGDSGTVGEEAYSFNLSGTATGFLRGARYFAAPGDLSAIEKTISFDTTCWPFATESGAGK